MSARLMSLALLLIAPLALAQQQQRRRIAVLNFDYATVHDGVSAIFGTNYDVGKGVADLLVEKLVGGGVYSVIERKALDKILTEQNFSNSDRADASTAAKIGRILGVDAILLGSITQFGRDDKVTNYGGSAITRMSPFGLGGISKKEAKAVVSLTARLVNVNTGEIVAVTTGKGESTRKGTSLLGAGGSSAGAGSGAYGMDSKNFGSTLIGEATLQAVAAVATDVDRQTGAFPVTIAKIDGLVADVSGASLVLNVGSKAGVRVGDKLAIKRVTRTVKDPATGKIIREISEAVGEATVTEVDEASAVATFTGPGAPKVGDKALTP